MAGVSNNGSHEGVRLLGLKFEHLAARSIDIGKAGAWKVE